MLDAIVNLEPNWHPVFVHFVVGLLFTATAVITVVAVAPQGWPRRASLQAAGDWMLALGIAAALVAIAAGFQAYYTVAHDEPAHEVMTEHRNLALVTAGVFLLLGVWRWLRRDQAPSILFALALIVAAGLLTSTAWHGGRLVFHHGLGVASLPQAEGPGHHHDHGHGHAHDEEGGASPANASGQDHEHGDGHDHENGGHDAVHDGDSAPTSADMSAQEPAGVVAIFHDALKRKDEETVREVLLPDVFIFESGNAERSLAEYAGHHLPADMEFASSVQRTVRDQHVLKSGDAAAVLTESVSKGTFNKQPVHARLMETMFLKRTDDGWRIAHIHWSSAKITEHSDQDDDHAHADGHDHEH